MQPNSLKKLLLAISLNLLISSAEAIAGFLSGSLALLADALHNLIDTLGLIISAVALKISRLPATSLHTFGLKRAETLASFINSGWLLLISALLLWHSVSRLFQPAEIKTAIMLPVAVVALLTNIFSALLLYRESRHNLNIRSSYLHLLADSFISAGVIITALAIKLFSFPRLDPAITIIFSIIIIRETLKVFKQSTHILMEGAPQEIDLKQIKAQVEKISGVKNIHHLHIWNISEGEPLFEAHLQVSCSSIEQAEAIRLNVENYLQKEFAITHSTLQLEFMDCSTQNSDHQF